MVAPRGFLLGRRIRNVGRLAQIANVFARHGFYSLVEKVGIARWLSPEQAREIESLSRSPVASEGEGLVEEIHGFPARFRAALEELGPAFVKLGQVLAVRQDILPKAFTEELSKLHANVTPVAFSAVQNVLRQELGEELLAKFAKIDPKPFAAGSIAQVHRATFVDGSEVAIKVQRPDIRQQMETDLALMETIAGLIQKYIPETEVFSPVMIIEEFSRATISELDFIREAGSTCKVAANFSKVDYVDFPEVWWDYTTEKVLTMTFLKGLSVWDKDTLKKQGFDPQLLVERGLGVFLKMVFVDGLYHGDLHPGNLLVLPDNRVGILDFGLTVHISKRTQEHLAGLLVALVQEDFESMVDHFVELAEPSARFDQEAFQVDVTNAISPFIGLRLQQIHSGKQLWDLARIAARHGAPMPRELILFLRTLVAFEGVGSRLNPDFEIISTCEKFTQDIVRQMYSRKNLERQALMIGRDFARLARLAPRQVRQLLKATLEGELKFNLASTDVRRLAVAIDRSVSRLAVSVIVASLVIASAIFTFAKAGGEYFHMSLLGLIGSVIASVLGIYVLMSILRGGRL